MNIKQSNSRFSAPSEPAEWRVKLEKKRAKRRRIVRKLVTWVVVLALAGGAYWFAQIPGTPDVTLPPPIAQSETDAIVSALKPKRERPVIAVVGINDGTETTDYLMPYGILKRADVADVFAVATGEGPVRLFPALTVQPDSTIAAFDVQHPEGADYVVVPAMERDDDAKVVGWLREQHKKGATIIGVCVGAMIVANAGLLDGQRATTHWYFRERMFQKHPSITYVKDRRFVVDDGVVTTTGISASMPMSLTLIEAIAGRERAVAVAGQLGLTHWDAWHPSEKYLLTRSFALTVARNRLTSWSPDRLGAEITPGVDEVSLALVADALSRTYKSEVVSFAPTRDPVVSKNGLKIVPDEARSGWEAENRLAPAWDRPAALALEDALAEAASRYGVKTRDVVEMQLEYSN